MPYGGSLAVEFLGREKFEEMALGSEWFRSLDNGEKGQLGDDLVLGAFDWGDWFYVKPSRQFIQGVENERMLWEQT